jgi:uncharacterized protein YcaQ
MGVGMLGATASSELSYGTGTAADRARALAALVKEGRLIPVQVEGLKGPRFVLREERGLLAEPLRELEAHDREVTLLAPLDPLVWDRRMLRDLFGFDYIWEVYTPERKRKYGYYVLPMLFGDRIVGRIEPRFDRKSAVLEIKGLWFEEGFPAAKERGFNDALDRAIEALAGFAGAESTRWIAERPRR